MQTHGHIEFKPDPPAESPDGTVFQYVLGQAPCGDWVIHPDNETPLCARHGSYAICSRCTPHIRHIGKCSVVMQDADGCDIPCNCFSGNPPLKEWVAGRRRDPNDRALSA